MKKCLIDGDFGRINGIFDVLYPKIDHLGKKYLQFSKIVLKWFQTEVRTA